MPQHDQVLDNANGLTFRNDLNSALAALFSSSSGTEPTAKVAGQLWFDTSTPGTNLLKVRDQTNAFWITVYSAANEAYDEQVGRLAAAENLLINGGFGVNQAGLGAVASIAGNAPFADGWIIGAALTGATAQLMSIASAPPGLRQTGPNRTRVTVQTAKGSLAAGDFLQINQGLEGTTTRHLGWGLAGGKPVLLRFGIKAPAGTYGVSLVRTATPFDNWMSTFTVAAGEANTDKIVVLQISAPPTGTAWDGTTARAFTLRICLAAGTTYQGSAGWSTSNLLSTSGQFNILASTSNVVELFDVKLVPNLDNLNTDPGFAAWDTTKETLRCMRYLQVGIRLTAIFSAATSGQTWRVNVPLSVPMRIAPTVTQTTAGTPTASAAPVIQSSFTNSVEFTGSPSATGQSGVSSYIYQADAQL